MVINEGRKLLIRHFGEIHEGKHYSIIFACNRKVAQETLKLENP